MKILLLLLLVVSQPVVAQWYVIENGPMCTSLRSLNYQATKTITENVTDIEQQRINNECDITHDKLKVMPHFKGIYSFVQARNYEGKLKEYYINTRDLVFVKALR